VHCSAIDDACSHADAVEALRRGIVIGSTSLGDSKDALVACHGALHGTLGPLAAHEQRGDHVWEKHHIAQWHGGQASANREGQSGPLGDGRMVF